jgi:hypothetical protein
LRDDIRDSTKSGRENATEATESSIDGYFTDPFTKQERSEIRSIRLPKLVEAKLVQEASSKGMSVSALIYSILDRHVNWESAAQKFGFLTLPGETLSIGLDHLDSNTVMEIARIAGTTVPKQLILFLFDEVTPSAFLKWVDFMSRYERLADWKVERTGDMVVMTGHHQMESNWTTWIASYMEAAVRSTLNVLPEVEQDDGTVRIRFDLAKASKSRASQ